MDDLSAWDVRVGSVTGRWDKANLKVVPQDASPGRFAAGSRLCAEQDGKRQLLEVRTSKRQGKHWICDVGAASQEQAEALIGASLWIHREMRAPLPEGEFYLGDVLGLRVLTEDGEDWGEVEEILETPAHNIYVTKMAMIPAHREFIARTDWEKRQLIVRDIPGLKLQEKEG